MDIDTSLTSVMAIDGAVAAALVDCESGMVLGAVGGDRFPDLELAAAGDTEVVRAKMRTMQSLNVGDDIEDIVITLGRHYTLFRLLRSNCSTSLFLYLALDRTADPALARHELALIEKALTV